MNSETAQALRRILQAPSGLAPEQLLESTDALLGDNELAGNVRDAILRLQSSVTEDAVRHAQKAIVQTMPRDLGAALIVRTVVQASAAGQLTPEEAARILAATPFPQRSGLSTEESALVDVADAVLEDRKDRVMEIGDDDLFRQAIERVLRSVA